MFRSERERDARRKTQDILLNKQYMFISRGERERERERERQRERERETEREREREREREIELGNFILQ